MLFLYSSFLPLHLFISLYRHEATLQQFTDTLSSMDDEHKDEIEALLADLKLTMKQVETGTVYMYTVWYNNLV